MDAVAKEFWSNVSSYCPDVIQTITDLSRKSYYSVTDLTTRRVWWSQPAMEFFGLEKNYTVAGEEKTKLTVHPDDREIYQKGFSDFVSGKNTEQELEYRIQSRRDHYDRFSVRCKMLKDAEGCNRFMVVHYDNHGIADEVDPVTGLHTEPTMMRDMQDFIDRGVNAVIVKIGLDLFSRANVLYGTAVADAVLNATGQMLISCKGEKGFVYRLVGAKFAVILRDTTMEEAKLIYNTMAQYLSRQLVVDGKRVPMKVSGGATVLNGEVEDVSVIRSQLTYALEESRWHKHGELAVFDDRMEESDKLKLVGIIHRDAIDDKSGFYLAYQPIISKETGKIVGMEALIRWAKEPYGTVPPGVFIEWLEESACIFDLGNWILETALRDCKRISDKYPGFFVQVNVCPLQLERKDFEKTVIELIEKTGLKPEQLTIELTERCRTMDLGLLKAETDFFRSHGIKVALDDFGTGVSSLNVILEMMVDEIKLDMTFIRDIADKEVNQVMVDSLLRLAGSMKIQSCLEGVEDERVYEHLKQYGNATFLQGYHFSKPIPIDSVMELVSGQ